MIIEITIFVLLSFLLGMEVYLTFLHDTLLPIFPLRCRLYIVMFTSVLWTWLLEISVMNIRKLCRRNNLKEVT